MAVEAFAQVEQGSMRLAHVAREDALHTARIGCAVQAPSQLLQVAQRKCPSGGTPRYVDQLPRSGIARLIIRHLPLLAHRRENALTPPGKCYQRQT